MIATAMRPGPREIAAVRGHSAPLEWKQLRESDLKAPTWLWRVHELAEGETIAGAVVRLPTPGAFNGSRLFLRTDAGEVLGLSATAKRGYAVLERELIRQAIAVGERIAITYHGARERRSGEGWYRLYEVVQL